MPKQMQQASCCLVPPKELLMSLMDYLFGLENSVETLPGKRLRNVFSPVLRSHNLMEILHRALVGKLCASLCRGIVVAARWLVRRPLGEEIRPPHFIRSAYHLHTCHITVKSTCDTMCVI